LARASVPMMIAILWIRESSNVAANPIGSGKTVAVPALNVKSGKIDRMRVEYFSDKLVDETVQSLLEPYVARKSG
jgi:hypothetical protein